MFTVERLDISEDICIETEKIPLDQLLAKEWLLTNKRGSYSSSTLACCNARKYHGLLIGSLSPPVRRIMSLNNLLELIKTPKKSFQLCGYQFDGLFSPEFVTPQKFYQDGMVKFDYSFEGVKLVKSICLAPQKDVVFVIYDFLHLEAPVTLEMRPFVGLRDFHSLLKSSRHFIFSGDNRELVVRRILWPDSRLILSSEQGDFIPDEQWWYNILYRVEKERGMEYSEDLWSPGIFRVSLDSPRRIVFRAELQSVYPSQNQPQEKTFSTQLPLEIVQEDLFKHRQGLLEKARTMTTDNTFYRLLLAADQFLVKRQMGDKESWTILAGYPWFADWGRDAFISLPGLLLSTGRFDEAREVLTTFSQAAEGGMIPNCYDDHTNQPLFNSIDASLWFVNAAFEYLRAGEHTEIFLQQFLPVIRWIVDSYSQGARFGIRMDSDGLLTGGDENTQLTWMDAKFDGLSFTPRYGKAVEVNALWYNALCELSQFYSFRNAAVSKQYKNMSELAMQSFQRIFWNDTLGFLNDSITPDGKIDTSLRPNQIFAVSMHFTPVNDVQARHIVEAVQKNLLTPYGLRTLDPINPQYKGTYSGSWKQRDAAYHQGTVWPYLIGAFVTAFLKVNGFNPHSKQIAAKFIEPLLENMMNDGCIGQVCEIFDGDPPQKNRGCFAQAWSVAELIRAYLLINS